MERRRAARRIPALDESLSQARLRAGRDLLVCDLSGNGALVEGASRLLPGTHVDIHLVTRGGRLLVRCRVVRAYVSQVLPDVITYRGALAFDRGIDAQPAGYAIPGALAGMATAPGTDYPNPAGAAEDRAGEQLSA